jgi:hypothetical protein
MATERTRGGARDATRALALLVVLVVLASACTTTLRGSQIPDPALAKERVRIHIESNKPVALRRNIGLRGYAVCRAPCDALVPVDPENWFELEGDFPPPGPFELDERGPEVRIELDAGSSVGEAWGVVATTMGGTAAGVTAFLTPVLYALDAGEGAAFKPNVVGALVGTHIVGVIALAMGIPALVISQSHVEISPDPSKSGARGPLTVQF